MLLLTQNYDSIKPIDKTLQNTFTEHLQIILIEQLPYQQQNVSDTQSFKLCSYCIPLLGLAFTSWLVTTNYIPVYKSSAALRV